MIASRGGFTFNYVVVPDPVTDYTSWLSTLVPHVDLVASEWYSDTTTRRQLGLEFTQQIVDASLVLVTIQGISQQLDILSFLLPFDKPLWGCIVLVTLINGLINWLVDTPDPSKGEEGQITLFRSIYQSASTITGADVRNQL